MGTVFKILAGLLLALFLLLGLAIALVAYAFDPNQFRGKITAEVKQSTGRELAIGDIHLSVFPTLGARVRGLTLSNAAGFGSTPFATMSEASFGVRLIPLLLRQDIEVGAIVVDGLQLNLEKHEDGTTNWDDLSESDKANPPSAPKPAAPVPAPPQPKKRDLEGFAIGAVTISNAALSYRDDKAGKTYSLSKVTLDTGSIKPGKAFDFDLRFTTALGELTGAPGVTADSEISAKLLVDSTRPIFDATGLKAKLEVGGSQIPGGHQKAEFSADVHLDGLAGEFRLANAKLEAAGLVATTNLEGAGFDGNAPHFSGPLTLQPFSPRDVLKAFSIPLETADATALKNASLSVQIEGGENSATFSDVALTLDDSHVTGKVAVKDFASQALDLALKLDRIDVDRYMPAAKTASGAAPAPAAGKNAGDDAPIPLGALNQLNLVGTLDVASLKLQGMSLSEAHVKISAPRGSEKHVDLTADLYGGTANSSTRIATGAKPTYAETLKLASVSIAPLLKDFNGKDKISGDATIALDVTSDGRTVGEAKRALNGTLSYEVKNGAVKGFNLAAIVRRGQALLNGQSFADDSSTTSQQTDFSSLTGSGKFVNGVLHADQLDAESPLFRLSGAGLIDLVNRSLDYLLKPTFVNSLSGQGGKSVDDTSGILIPVHVTGSFDHPHYAIDVKTAFEQKAAQKLLDQVENGKLGDKLNHALGKLFGGGHSHDPNPPPTSPAPQNAPNP